MTASVSGDTYTIEFQFPEGARFDEIALYTDTDALVVGASTQVIGAVNGFGTLVSMHPTPETLIAGDETEVGNVWSKGNIRVSAGAHVNGFARTPGAVIPETGGTVDDDQQSTDFDDAVPPFSLVVEFLDPTPPDAEAETGLVNELPPGSYGTVTVEENGTLELRSGTYHLDALEMHPAGRVHVRANGGPVVLNVRNTLELAGSVSIVAGNASQFRIVYVGTADIDLTAPLFASVFAPLAQVTLNPGTGDTDEFVGAIFAAGITTLDGVVVRQQAFFDAPTPFVARYFYGFMGPVGAGPYERTLPVEPETSELAFGGGELPALHDLEDADGNPTNALTIGLRIPPPADPPDPPERDSRTYTLVIEEGSDTERIETVIVQAAEGTRPFVTITGDGTNAANLTPASRTSSAELRRFEVDGVWFGTSDDAGTTRSRDFVIAPANPPAATGDDWDEIVIRHSTLDPGGERADRTRIAALKLNVTGKVTKILIERSIVGPIEVTGGGLVDEIEIRDSIVDATELDVDTNGRRVAIRSGNGIVRLTGVTVFGDIEADILEASDSIVTGQLIVADTQASCFRFSAASEGQPSRERLPRLFHSTIAPDGIEATFFTSQRFGDPGYAQVAELVPDFIATGAENGSELGAFSFLLGPIRLASILAKVDEFKPIGVIAQYIVEGEDAAQ
jgi:hypothetical protein